VIEGGTLADMNWFGSTRPSTVQLNQRLAHEALATTRREPKLHPQPFVAVGFQGSSGTGPRLAWR